MRGRFIHFSWDRFRAEGDSLSDSGRPFLMTLILAEAFSGCSADDNDETPFPSAALCTIAFGRVALSRLHLSFLCKGLVFQFQQVFSFFSFLVSLSLAYAYSRSVSPFCVCFISQLTFVIAWEMRGETTTRNSHPMGAFDESPTHTQLNSSEGN